MKIQKMQYTILSNTITRIRFYLLPIMSAVLLCSYIEIRYIFIFRPKILLDTPPPSPPHTALALFQKKPKAK